MSESSASAVVSLIAASSGLTRAQLEAALGDPASGTLSDELERAILARAISFSCEAWFPKPDHNNYCHHNRAPQARGLVRFQPVSSNEGVCARDEVIRDVVRFLDNQDDLGRMSSPTAFAGHLFGSLNRDHGYEFPDVVAALHRLIEEAVVYIRLYNGEDTLLFGLVRNYRYSVFAFSDEGSRRFCFHVRAGTAAVAVRKIRDVAAYEEVQVLALVNGYVTPVAEPRSTVEGKGATEPLQMVSL